MEIGGGALAVGGVKTEKPNVDQLRLARFCVSTGLFSISQLSRKVDRQI